MAKQPIPDEALDDRLFFGGTPGAGKTYNAMGRVERLLRKRHRVITPDPLGVWWGLRLAADGKSPSGYDVVIFGGPHGDLPLSEHAGALIGETVAGMKESCILDLSQLGTKAAERRFMLAFLTALYKHATGEPVHIVFDEADMWAPQRLMDKEGEAAKLYGITETIVRRGRVKGFVPWLISQRPAVIAKDVLSMIDGLVAFKLTSSQDRDAIGNWVEGQADKAMWRDIWASLPTMERGQGVVWIPARGILDTVQFPPKETFDSSRTPKRGERAKRAAKLKALDLGKLRERLTAVEAETKANDPRALRAEVARLTAELKKAGKTAPASAAAPAKADPQTKATIAALRKALEATMKFIIEINAKEFFKAGGEAINKKAVEKALKDASEAITRVIEKSLEGRAGEFDRLRKQGQRIVDRFKTLLEEDITVRVDVKHNEPFTISPAPTPAAPRPRPAARNLDGGEGQLTGPQLKLLQALAWWRAMGHEAVTRAQAAAIAGWKTTGSNIKDRASELRVRGLVAGGADALSLTPEGIAAAPEPDMAATLVEGIRAVLSGPQRSLFDLLLERGGGPIESTAAAEALNWQPGGSNIKDRTSELAVREIVHRPSPGMIALQDWVR
jgi:hypothetical protein